MTREESTKILGTLKSAFPSRYKGITKEQALDMIDLYTAKFNGFSFSDVNKAVNACIDESDFHPTIKDIKSKLKNVDRSWMREHAEKLKVAVSGSVSRYARLHGITWEQANEVLNANVQM